MSKLLPQYLLAIIKHYKGKLTDFPVQEEPISELNVATQIGRWDNALKNKLDNMNTRRKENKYKKRRTAGASPYKVEFTIAGLFSLNLFN